MLILLWTATGCLEPVKPALVADSGGDESGNVRFYKGDVLADGGRLGGSDTAPDDVDAVDDLATADMDALGDGLGLDAEDAADTLDIPDIDDVFDDGPPDVADADAEDQLADQGDFDGDADDTASDALADAATASDAAADATAVGCGDGTCGGGETCTSCAQDCGACPKPLCEVLGAIGCAAGEQCYPNGDKVFCAKAGALAPGAACTFYNDCAVSELCAAGLCRSLCDYSGKNGGMLCKPGVPCEKLLVGGTTDANAKLGVCKPGSNCDPLTDSGCGSNNCVPSGWLKTCVNPGPGGSGAPCQSSADCQLGNLCDAGTCRAKCSTGGDTLPCKSGACQAFLGPDGQPVPGFVGTCH